MSVTDLSEKTKFDRTTIHRYLRGQEPARHRFKSLAEALGTTIEYLMDGTGPIDAPQNATISHTDSHELQPITWFDGPRQPEPVTVIKVPVYQSITEQNGIRVSVIDSVLPLCTAFLQPPGSFMAMRHQDYNLANLGIANNAVVIIRQQDHLELGDIGWIIYQDTSMIRKYLKSNGAACFTTKNPLIEDIHLDVSDLSAVDIQGKIVLVLYQP